MSIDIGSPAPDFTLPASGGQSLSLSDFSGRTLVIYFYPKDDTSGCTKEAIGFTEAYESFAAAGVTVLGVSKDTVAKHDKFIAKHDLGVTLLSDAEGQMCEDYGVWVEKSMYGKKYMGIERATFVIGPDGVISHMWRKVKVPGHVDAVLAAVQA